MSGIWKILGLLLMQGMLHQVHAMSFSKSFWGYDVQSQSLTFFDMEIEPDPIKVVVTGKLALCNHMDRGHIILEVSGGTPPYDFTWQPRQESK